MTCLPFLYIPETFLQIYMDKNTDNVNMQAISDLKSEISQYKAQIDNINTSIERIYTNMNNRRIFLQKSVGFVCFGCIII